MKLRRTQSLHLVALGMACYLCVFAQATFDAPQIWLRARVDLLPGLVVFAALAHGLPGVFVVGVAGGLLFDALSVNPPGVSTVALLVTGTAVYHSRDLLLKDQLYPQFILGTAASAGAPLAGYFLLAGTGLRPLIEWTTLWQWLVMALGGGLMTPVWFRLFSGLDRTLQYQEIPESSFRPDREIERGRS